MKLKIIETSQCPAGAHPGNESRTSHTKHRLVSPTAAATVFTQQQICVIQHCPFHIKLFHEHTNTRYGLKKTFPTSLVRGRSVSCLIVSNMFLFANSSKWKRFILRLKRFLNIVTNKWLELNKGVKF